MVIDVVLYNGEQEMFEIRYNILKDVVGEFILVEGEQTFSGKDKIFPHIAMSKVRHHILRKDSCRGISVPAEMYPNFNIEYAQREAMKQACSHLKDGDIVFVGDVDEIWNPEILKSWDHVINNMFMFKLEQKMYYYFINNRWNRDWAGTFVGHWQDLKNISWNTARQGPGQRMDQPSSFFNLIRNAGWHFTNCMPLAEIKRKLESYSHQEYNNPSFKDSLLYKMENNIDYYGIKFPENLDEENLPQYLKDNKEKYKHLWKSAS